MSVILGRSVAERRPGDPTQHLEKPIFFVRSPVCRTTGLRFTPPEDDGIKQ
jgi:hypothetical protein